MKKLFAFILAVAMLLTLTACGNTISDSAPPSDTAQAITAPVDGNIIESEPSVPDDTAQAPSAPDAGNIAEDESTVADIPTQSSNNTDTERAPDMTAALDSHSNTLYLQVGDTTFTATLVENSSVEALRELLAEGPVTIDMRDYGGFEKVGEFGISLPRNDEPINAEPGDLILYQGNSLVIFYAPNSWNYTRLGKINDVTAEELKNTLGSGNVSVTLSLSQG